MKVGGVGQVNNRVNQVKNFVRKNVARMEMMESKGSNSTEEVTYVFTPGRVSVIGNPATSKETILKLLGHPDANKPSTEGKPMYLYGKNGEYLGQHMHNSYVDGQLWHTLIMGEDLKPKAQEIVYVKRNEKCIHPETEEEIDNMKKLATQITTITTVLDHVKDKFITVKKVCKLVNPLEEVKADDPNCIFAGTYKSVKNPRYICCVDEVINEGSISEVNKKIMDPQISGKRPSVHTPRWIAPIHRTTNPGKYWWG